MCRGLSISKYCYQYNLEQKPRRLLDDCDDCDPWIMPEIAENRPGHLGADDIASRLTGFESASDG